MCVVCTSAIFFLNSVIINIYLALTHKYWNETVPFTPNKMFLPSRNISTDRTGHIEVRNISFQQPKNGQK